MLEVLAFVYCLEIGYMPTNKDIAGSLDRIEYLVEQENLFDIDMTMGFYLFDILYLGGNYSSQFLKAKTGHTFSPVKDTFEFDTHLRFTVSESVIKFGYQHQCRHLVHTYGYDSNGVVGVYDRFYLSVSNK